MRISKEGIELIISFEGKHKKIGEGLYAAYLDPVGVPTIYTGLTEGVYMGMTVTEKQGMKLFRKELERFEDAVNRLVKVKITQAMFDALVSFAYNLGEGNLSRSTLLKKINSGNFNVRSEFMKYVWATDRRTGVKKKLRGLVRRRAAEAKLFNKETKEHWFVKVLNTILDWWRSR